jgi:anthranilate phosphoribosyltransferase
MDVSTFSTPDWQQFLTGECQPSKAFAILEALHPERVSAETVQTLLTLLKAQAHLNESLTSLKNTPNFDLLDCCGTGGSGQPSFNTSTTVAFILAAGGVPTLKFGNRGATSASGSFDFLEGLGLPPQQLSASCVASVKAVELGFLFAPDVYPALKPLALLRKQFGQPIVFNFLGPLLNPLQPVFRVMGCSSARMMPILAESLSKQPTLNKALIVRNASGMDEALPTQYNEGFLIEKGLVTPWQLAPLTAVKQPIIAIDFSVVNAVAWFKQLIGAEPKTTLPECLEPLVTLNAGLGFWIAGKTPTVEAGISLAENLLHFGAVNQQYKSFLKQM